MKVDYLEDGSDDCPLVRIYDFSGAEARHLQEMFQALADGALKRASLDAVESVDGTQITFVRSTRDGGVVKIGSHLFEVALSAEGWRQAEGLTEPFCDGSSGYQWLVQTLGIQLLLSKAGDW